MASNNYQHFGQSLWHKYSLQLGQKMRANRNSQPTTEHNQVIVKTNTHNKHFCKSINNMNPVPWYYTWSTPLTLSGEGLFGLLASHIIDLLWLTHWFIILYLQPLKYPIALQGSLIIQQSSGVKSSGWFSVECPTAPTKLLTTSPSNQMVNGLPPALPRRNSKGGCCLVCQSAWQLNYFCWSCGLAPKPPCLCQLISLSCRHRWNPQKKHQIN